MTQTDFSLIIEPCAQEVVRHTLHGQRSLLHFNVPCASKNDAERYKKQTLSRGLDINYKIR